jgi:SAP domain
MPKAVVIVDSYGQVVDTIVRNGQQLDVVEYHERGKEIEVSSEEWEAARNLKNHPPAGALAAPGSRLAAELSKPVAAAVNPDQARAYINTLVARDRRESDEDMPEPHGVVTPEGTSSTEPVTGVDPGVQYSRSLRQGATFGADVDAEGDYENMKKDELVALADTRGIDTSGKTKAELVEALREDPNVG